MIEFEYPWVFLALPLPLIINRLLPSASKAEPSLHIPFYDQIADLKETQTFSFRDHRINLFFLIVMWLLLILAAGRPSWINEYMDVPNSGRNLILAIDLSDSMKKSDLSGNEKRVDVVKGIVGEFVARRKGDRLGLILFGSNAYLQAPLTFDRNIVGQLLEESQLGYAGPYTAITDAIGLSIKTLREQPETNRVLILLTDGCNTVGEFDTQQAAKYALVEKVKIYTITIGTQICKLGKISEITGGKYFRVNKSTELKNVFKHLDKLEPENQKFEKLKPRKTLFHWPLGMALIISFILSVIQLFRYKSPC